MDLNKGVTVVFVDRDNETTETIVLNKQNATKELTKRGFNPIKAQASLLIRGYDVSDYQDYTVELI